MFGFWRKPVMDVKETERSKARQMKFLTFRNTCINSENERIRLDSILMLISVAMTCLNRLNFIR